MNDLPNWFIVLFFAVPSLCIVVTIVVAIWKD